MRLFSNRSYTDDVKMWEEQQSGTWGDSRVCHWCSYHILTASVIYYWTDTGQHGICLCFIIMKQTATDKGSILKYLNITRKPAFAASLPAFANTKIAIWRKLFLYKIEQFYWLLCVAKNWDWSTKVTPLSNLIKRLFSWNENLQRKQNWAAKSWKSTNL